MFVLDDSHWSLRKLDDSHWLTRIKTMEPSSADLIRYFFLCRLKVVGIHLLVPKYRKSRKTRAEMIKTKKRMKMPCVSRGKNETWRGRQSPSSKKLSVKK